MSSIIRPLVLLSALGTFGAPQLLAQAPGVPIVSADIVSNSKVTQAAEQLRKDGALLSKEKVAELLSKPTGGKIGLIEPARKPLPPRAIAARAREAHVRLGWHYLCKRCDNWHLNVAGSYAVAADVLATCHHCLVAKDDMKEGYLVAIDSEMKVYAVQEVIASSATMDCALVRVKDAQFKPLALQDEVAPGDAAYCYSDPLNQHGYFSDGIVNRFYWRRGKRGDAGSLDELKSLRLNVSTDWAPGSSGSAVLDECGNAIGHVSRIMPLSRGRNTPPPSNKDTGGNGDSPKRQVEPGQDAVMITLHDAVPARGVKALALKAAEAPAKAPEKEAPAEKEGEEAGK